jgi:hypothetical protein
MYKRKKSISKRASAEDPVMGGLVWRQRRSPSKRVPEREAKWAPGFDDAAGPAD